MPGGVSSPVRSFASVGGEPFFVGVGRGARVRDADGRSYIDYVQSYGPHLFGHAPLFVRRAISKAAAQRDVLRSADGAGGPARRARRRDGALDRDGALRQLGHRGHDERRPPGARRRRGAADREGRGRLPRPRGRVPRLGGLGRRDARDRRQPRRSRRDRRAHDRRALQRPDALEDAFASGSPARSRPSSSSRSPRTWASCPPARATWRRCAS